MPDAFDHFLSFQKERNIQRLKVKERKFEFPLSSLLSLQVSGVTRELLKILAVVAPFSKDFLRDI